MPERSRHWERGGREIISFASRTSCGWRDTFIEADIPSERELQVAREKSWGGTGSHRSFRAGCGRLGGGQLIGITVRGEVVFEKTFTFNRTQWGLGIFPDNGSVAGKSASASIVPGVKGLFIVGGRQNPACGCEEFGTKADIRRVFGKRVRRSMLQPGEDERN